MAAEPGVLLQAMAEEYAQKVIENAELKVKITEYVRQVEHLRKELGEAQDLLNDTVTGILDLAPECWEADEFAGETAIKFVKALIEHSATKPVHRYPDCTDAG